MVMVAAAVIDVILTFLLCGFAIHWSAKRAHISWKSPHSLDFLILSFARAVAGGLLVVISDTGATISCIVVFAVGVCKAAMVEGAHGAEVIRTIIIQWNQR